MALIGYARVSTGEQSLDPQIRELAAAGCTTIHEEYASGGNRARPVLARVLDRIEPGDTLVIVRLDRLARSLAHLLSVIEALDARGAHFRSLGDPVDTASPQGRFTLQILGSVAELERALIRERTQAGLRVARAAGRVGGNPGLRAKDAAAIRKNALARDSAFMHALLRTSGEWVPIVRRHRPERDWQTVTDMVNASLPRGNQEWSPERLKRAARRFVKEGILDAAVMERAPPQHRNDHLTAVVAAIAGAEPRPTLRQIADRLQDLRERTPRGASRWSLSSVKMLVDRARAQGMLDG
ncbi:recombinase family protein [Halovulum sp. GXIMD14794]